MSVFYRCKRCGRFAITDVLKLNAAQILAKAAAMPALPCPICGALSRRCETRKAN